VMDRADTEIALAWPAARTTDLVEEFVGVVRGRSERSSRSPATRAKSPAPQKKTPVKRPTAGKTQPKKKPAKRRGR
ncbi:LysR family transcriptional regulator, partial [Streptomyces lydicus]